MIRPRPNTHAPNPTAVPIKEAIKETFRVFMACPQLFIRQERSFVPSGFRYFPGSAEGVLPSCQTPAPIRSGSRRQARFGSMMFSASDAPHADHHRVRGGGCSRWHSRVSGPAGMAVGRLALAGGLG